MPELHHGSHNHLLTRVESDGEATAGLDAIIVPTFRPVDALRDSMAVARDANCLLVALCSGPADAKQSVALGKWFGTQVLAIDVHDVRPKMPRFHTDDLLGRTNFSHGSDLSMKRNLGLLLGRVAGWSRVLFLDDDIWDVRAAELPGAADLLEKGFRAVGLQNRGFADNSVVCHAYREIGAEQDSFIGGGAMLVDPATTRSFFPNIYNEDWFFLLGDGVPFRAAVSGSMVQRTYDPFADSRRAAGEELGDTLAEGLFWLLDDNRDPRSGDAAFWGDFLYRRRRLFDHVLRLVDTNVEDVSRREPIRAALREARGRSSFITPWLCTTFVSNWFHDLSTWRAFIDHFSEVSGVDKAISELGLSHVTHRS